MRSLRLVAALARTALLRRFAFAFGLALFLALAAAAQQPAAGRQKVPRLTSDDVARPPAAQPVEESKEASGKTDEAKKLGEPAATAAQPTAGEEKVSAEESSWRDRVGKARNRAKELERAAEQGELRITALRNQLGTSGESARYRNEVAAEMDQAGRQLKDLRAEAHAAADDLAELVEYGKAKSFTEAEGPKPVSEEGQSNAEYYRSQFARLTEELENAQRRIQLYNDRVRDLNQQLSTNSSGKDKSGRKTGGDSFFSGQLQKDREEAQQKLDEARGALAKAQSDLEDLREEARRAGVPPAVFR